MSEATKPAEVMAFIPTSNMDSENWQNELARIFTEMAQLSLKGEIETDTNIHMVQSEPSLIRAVISTSSEPCVFEDMMEQISLQVNDLESCPEVSDAEFLGFLKNYQSKNGSND